MLRYLLSVLILFAITGCGYQLDTTRHPAERGTLGEEIYRIEKADMDRLHPPEGEALGRERDLFVQAVDSWMPAPHDDLQAFLVAVLPLYDQGFIPGIVRPTACLLGTLSQEDSALNALWYLRHPQGYGDNRVLLPLLRRLGSHPGIDLLLSHLGTLWTAHDGFDGSFQPSTEDDTFTKLLSDWLLKLRQAEADQPDPQSTAAVVTDFLLSEDARLLNPLLPEQWIVRTDTRGRVLPATDSNTGALLPPFVDTDGDSLADILSTTGDFIDANGKPLVVPPPFDGSGNRPQQDGRWIYRYCDLRQSVLGSLLDQIPPLVGDGILWKLPDALPALLGPLSPRADADGLYSGYDPKQAPLLSLVHAVLQTADYPRLPEFLEAVLTLAEYAEPQLARLIHEIDRVSDIVDQYPQVSLTKHNRMLDDLVPHLQESAGRGYLLNLLQAFSDQRLAGLQKGLADMIRYRDWLLSPQDMQFKVPTDPTLPDSDYYNRSNFQRVLHLIYDTHGAKYKANIDPLHLFVIPDLLVFYVDSASGDKNHGLASVPGWISPFISEFSSSTPPAEDVNRFIVDDHSVLGNPTGNEGKELSSYNGRSLLALELSGALNSLRPVFAAFAAYDRGLSRTGTQVLADLMTVMHPHYSANTPNASPACANIRPLEPMLLDVLDHTGVLDVATDLLAVAATLKTPSGLAVLPEVDQFLRFLVTPNGNLTRFDGATSVPGGDGLTPIFPISPLYLVLDGCRTLRDAVSADPTADSAFAQIKHLLYDRFFAVEETGSLFRFHNRSAWTLLLNTVSFLQRRAGYQRDHDNLSARLKEIDGDLRDDIGGRVFPRVVKAWNTLAADTDLPGEIDGLVLDFLDESTTDSQRELRRLAAWAIQTLVIDRVLVPWKNTLGRLLDPTGSAWQFIPGQGCNSGAPPFPYVTRLMDLVPRLAETLANGQREFANLVADAVGSYPSSQGYPLDDLMTVLEAVHRADPTQTGELSAGDYSHILSQVSDFLLDGSRGFEKLYQMVARRNGY